MSETLTHPYMLKLDIDMERFMAERREQTYSEICAAEKQSAPMNPVLQFTIIVVALWGVCALAGYMGVGQ